DGTARATADTQSEEETSTTTVATGTGAEDTGGAEETGSAEDTAGSEETSGSGEDVDPCTLVEDATVETFVGGEAQVEHKEVDPSLGGTQCLYGMSTGALVVVGSMTADTWLAQIPTAIEGLESSGLLDATTQEQLDSTRRLLEENPDMGGDEACALFSDMAEAQGAGQGVDELVNYVPNATDPIGVSGQRCRDGVYSNITLQAEGLVDDVATYSRVLSALDTVHQAGVQALG
ncbi:MAG: hypothetical protein ACK5RL_05895, partial [Acidimicrobiales bacterium]